MKMVIFTLVIAILVIDWLAAVLEFATGRCYHPFIPSFCRAFYRPVVLTAGR